MKLQFFTLIVKILSKPKNPFFSLVSILDSAFGPGFFVFWGSVPQIKKRKKKTRKKGARIVGLDNILKQ